MFKIIIEDFYWYQPRASQLAEGGITFWFTFMYDNYNGFTCHGKVPDMKKELNLCDNEVLKISDQIMAQAVHIIIWHCWHLLSAFSIFMNFFTILKNIACTHTKSCLYTNTIIYFNYKHFDRNKTVFYECHWDFICFIRSYQTIKD